MHSAGHGLDITALDAGNMDDTNFKQIFAKYAQLILLLRKVCHQRL